MAYVNSCVVVCIFVMLAPASIIGNSKMAKCTTKFSHGDVVVTCLGASTLEYVDCEWHHWLLSRNRKLLPTYPYQNGNHSIMCETTIAQPEVGKHTIELALVPTNLTTPKIRGFVQFKIERDKTEIPRNNYDVTFTHANENSSRIFINVTSKHKNLSDLGKYTLQSATSKKGSSVDSDLPFSPVVIDITRRDSSTMTSEVDEP